MVPFTTAQMFALQPCLVGSWESQALLTHPDFPPPTLPALWEAGHRRDVHHHCTQRPTQGGHDMKTVQATPFPPPTPTRPPAGGSPWATPVYLCPCSLKLPDKAPGVETCFLDRPCPCGGHSLGIGFLQQGAPELSVVGRVEEDQAVLEGGQPVIDDHVQPLAVLPELSAKSRG